MKVKSTTNSSRLSRVIDRFCVWRSNLGWWRVVGIPDLLVRKSMYEPANGLPSLPVDFFVSRNLVQTPDIIATVGVGQQSIKDTEQNGTSLTDFMSGGQ